MNNHTTAEIESSGILPSIWIDDVAPLFLTPLEEDIIVDVAIVGAGMAGLTTAYLLSREGLQVAVIDDGPIGGGETGRTTAHITNVLDGRFYHLREMFGPEKTKLAIEAHTSAIDAIETIIYEEGIACDFERLVGYLFLHPTDTPESITKEFEAAQSIGVVSSLAERAPLPFNTGRCIAFPDQAQFHSLKYLRGLSNAIRRLSGKIFTTTHAEKFESDKIVTGNGKNIYAKHRVITTHTPVNDLVTLHTKQTAYRSYVVAWRIPLGSVTKALYWDTGDQSQGHPAPYHYIRLQPVDQLTDYLIVGGEDHKTGQLPEGAHPFEKLEQWTRDRFPMVPGSPEYKWSGQIMESLDSLAFIGRNPGEEYTYIATGDCGNGISYGTIAGILIRDLILRRPNFWEDVYDPSRQMIHSVRDYARETLNVLGQYGDYLKHEEHEVIQQLGNGQGIVIRNVLDPIAAYRDDSGVVHQFSAVCPHLKGVVRWNDIEKTFDCPCHGSRFSAQGKVINGPANTDLSEIPSDSKDSVDDKERYQTEQHKQGG